jgi:CRISPR/Cas system-associated exonuclease Cas4 (RecB family)
MTYSFSRLSTYKACPRRFKFQYIDEIPDPSGDAARFGSLVHEALENDDVSMVMEDELAYLMFQRGRGILQSLGKEVIGKEKKLAIDNKGNPCDFFDERAIFRGVIDVLGNDFILDWKTGFKLPSPLQLGTYQLLAEAHGFYVSELKYAMLRFDKFETVYASPEIYNEALKFISETITNIEKDVDYNRNIDSHCDYCPYVAYCRDGLKDSIRMEDKAMELLLLQAQTKQVKELLKRYIEETGSDIQTDSGIYGRKEKVSLTCKNKKGLVKTLADEGILDKYSEVKSSDYDRLLSEHPEYEDMFKKSIRNSYGFKEFSIS